MRIKFIVLLLFATLIAFGCSSNSSSSSNPVYGDLNFTGTLPVGVSETFADGSPAGGFGLMGIYTLDVNSDTASAELNPLRTGALTDTLEVVDITNFLNLAPCADCAKIQSVSLDPDGNLIVSIGIKHPFGVGDPLKPITGRNRADLHVFNVEGIVAAQTSSTTSFPSAGVDVASLEFLNASGYTPYLDDVLDAEVFQTDANIHPYMLHFADYSEGNYDPTSPTGFTSVTDPPPSGNLVMAMGCDYDNRDYIFDLTEDVTYTYAIGCTYAVSSASKVQRFSPEYRVPQHLKKAASEVFVIPPTEMLKEMEPDVEVTFQVQVVDQSHGVEVGEDLNQMFADSSVGSVIMEIPGVLSSSISQTGADVISGTGHDPTDPLLFEFTFANELVATEGTYTGLVKVLDTYTPGLNTSPLLNGLDGIKRVDPLENPLIGLFDIDEFATYAIFPVDVELGFVGSDPVADITKSGTGCAPLVVDFDASGSTDADDDPMSIPLEFEFDFDYDGIDFTVDRTRSTDPTASHQYDTKGCYVAAVRVYDSHENTDIATVIVPVGGFLPTGSDTDITDGSITNIDFIHGAPTFVPDLAWPDMSDPSKGSARGNGYIYTAFYGESGGNGSIFFSRTNDDGTTWSTPVSVHDYDSSGKYSGCSIAADETGQVYVIWSDHYHRDIGLEYSADGGDTFTSVLIKDESDCSSWCYKPRMPDVAIDPTDPDNIIITQLSNFYGSDWFMGWDQMYVYHSTDGPDGTFNEVFFVDSNEWRPGWVSNVYRIHAHFAIDGNPSIVAMENSWIIAYKSTDGGETWSKTDPSLTALTIINPWHRDYDSTIDPNDPDIIYVVATPRNWASFAVEVYKSTDRINFTQIQNRINDNTSNIPRLCPSVTVNDSGVLYVMWHDRGSGDYDIMADYSCDGGSTFHTDTVFNTVDSGNEVDPDLIPNLCGDGVVCIWEQNGDQASGKLVSREG